MSFRGPAPRRSRERFPVSLPSSTSSQYPLVFLFKTRIGLDLRLDDEPRRAHLNILLREISTVLECVDESLQNLYAIIEDLGIPRN